jgi:adenylate cyclase
MSAQEADRKLAAILSADVAGYSRLMAEDEAATVRALAGHREAVGLLVRQHGGRLVDFTGDNFLVEFPTPTAAVTCASEIQGVVRVRNERLPAERRMEFRIGVHLAEVRVEGKRLYGDGVNVAARLQSLAEPGGICVSGAVRDQVGAKLAVSYADLGPQSLKNIPEPVRVFRMRSTEPAAVPTALTPPGRRWATLAGVVVVAVAAIAVGWRLLTRVEAAVAPGPIRSLAVLPLENLSGDPEQEYFADGMTETLIGDLGKIGALKVISRTSVMRYKGAKKPLPEIAAELGVDALLEGTVMREGDRVRVTAQLIDGRTDHHVWAERYDRDLRGVLELQSDVARQVARRIELELSPGEVALLANRKPPDPAAHDALLKGIYHFGRGTAESTRLATESFERAIALDPDYALAHAWLGFAWWRRAQVFGFATPRPGGVRDAVPPLEAMPRARAAALRALELDEALPEAHTVLGRIASTFDWDFPTSERHSRRALELNPSLPAAHVHLGYDLAMRGRHEEAIAAGRRAVELAPFDLTVRSSLVDHFALARRYDEALAVARGIVEMDPAVVVAHRAIARIHEVQGQYEQAIPAWEAAGVLDSARSAELRAALAAHGERGYWRALLRIAREQGARPDILAQYHAQLGERDEAFAELERAYEARVGQLALLRVTPFLDALRDDPRYDELVRRIGIPES